MWIPMVREPLWEGLPFVNSLSEVAVRSIRDVFVGIVIFLFSTNYFFLLSFSRPPGVCQNTKTPSHFTSGTVWRREWDSNPRGRDAQRLSCQSTNIQMGSRGRRFNHSAIPAQQPTKTPGRVLNHFQYLVESLDQRALEDTML